MKLCEVVGRVWPERSLEGMTGHAIVLVRERDRANIFAALDLMDAGVGSLVLVVLGEPARQITGNLPVDAVISAIVNVDIPSVSRAQ